MDLFFPLYLTLNGFIFVKIVPLLISKVIHTIVQNLDDIEKYTKIAITNNRKRQPLFMSRI